MAGNTFYLKIISANRVFFSGRCRSLIVPEYDGQKEILAHHEDMVIAIDEGEMRLQSVRRKSMWQEPAKQKSVQRSRCARSRVSVSITTQELLFPVRWHV